MYKEFAGPRNEGEEHRYKQHLKRIKEIKKKVKNSPPQIVVKGLFSPSMIKSDPMALGIIEGGNRELLRKINLIYRTKGKTDSKPTDYAYSSNYFRRKRDIADIEKQNKQLYQRIQAKEGTVKTREFERDYTEMRRRYLSGCGKDPNTKPLKLTRDWSITPLDSPIKPRVSARVKCYFDMEAKHLRKNEVISIGRIHIEVYRDFAPIAAENFIRLCRGDNNLSYKGTIIHKVFKGVMCLGGDVEMRKGLGGKSAFGFPIPNEDPLLEFNGPGVVGTFTPEAGKNTSQFLITFRDIKPLKKYFVAFGKIVYGHALDIIEEFGTKNGVPLMEIIIKQCGIVSPESEKQPRFGPPAIPQELIDLNEKIKNEEDRDRRQRLDFEEKQQFYKKYGFLTKLDPTVPYPLFPWKIQQKKQQDIEPQEPSSKEDQQRQSVKLDTPINQ